MLNAASYAKDYPVKHASGGHGVGSEGNGFPVSSGSGGLLLDERCSLPCCSAHITTCGLLLDTFECLEPHCKAFDLTQSTPHCFLIMC